MANSRNEANKYWYEAFSNILARISANMSCAFIAKIVKYDRKHHTADIQPLANLFDGQKSAQLLEIPVTENCYILDELLERLKPDFEATDSNSRKQDFRNSNFVDHFPKKGLLRAGVPVVCVVLDRDNDNWLGGREANTYDPETSRMHDINDSVIVGVLGGDAING